nr:hypothetical protein [Tanacetum cinerariifolium]
MDEALILHAKRLRIGWSNFRLLSDIKSKESTLQLVYDVLRLTPVFKAFLVTADVPKIYMQEFWETANVHHIKSKESTLQLVYDVLRLTPVFKAFLVTADVPEIYMQEFWETANVHLATRAIPPKPKASVGKTKSSSDTTITPPTAAAGPRLTTSKKGKQAAKASKAKSLSALSEVAMTEAQQMMLATKRSMKQTYISQASGSGADEGTGSIPGIPDEDEGDDEEEGGDDEQASDEEEFIHPSLSTHTE